MSDARRAAVWLALVAAIIVAGDHLLAFALDQVLLRSQFRYSRLYRGGNDAEVLLLGDSRGVHSFYAPAIDELTGLRAMNLSYNSMTPHVAEAVLLDYLERNGKPRIVIVEVTGSAVVSNLISELRTYSGLSPRLAALYASDYPASATAGRLFRLYPLNSEFFLQALHYMRHSDQDWIYRTTISAELRDAPSDRGQIRPLRAEVAALARIAAALRQRGIEVRFVVAPYFPARVPLNEAQFAATIERATGERVWNYVGALSDPQFFADRVHLNERGSRALLAMLVRDGAFGMARPAARF